MEQHSNIQTTDQSNLPRSSTSVTWHTNLTLGEDGSMVSIPNEGLEHPSTVADSSNILEEEQLSTEEEEERKRLSLLEERCAALMEEHRRRKESLALELGASLEEVEKRCENNVAKLLITTKARSGWNTFVSIKREEEVRAADANQVELAEGNYD